MSYRLGTSALARDGMNHKVIFSIAMTLNSTGVFIIILQKVTAILMLE